MLNIKINRPFATQAITLVVGFFLLSLCVLTVHAQQAVSNERNGSAHTERLTEEVWIDVRSWPEHQVDSIDGDLQIHYSDIVSGVSKTFPNKNTPIRLYCAVGGRAQKALKSLESAGYKDIKNLGGIDQVRALRGL